MNGTTGKKLSSDTVKKHHTLLKTALKLAVRQDMIRKNPIEQVETPKYVKPKVSYYTADEMRSLFQVVGGDMLLPAVYLAALLGLRREEICGLKWANVDLGKPINPGYLSSRFRKCIIANQLPHITLHGLRHSVTSIANKAGATMFNISKMLGHSSPDVTGSGGRTGWMMGNGQL